VKVFVTGGCGFLGSHVCEFYIRKGVDIVAYDNMTKYELKRTGLATKKARNFNYDELVNLGVTVVKNDIRNYEALIDHANGCDYIIHTAAQPAMTISEEDPRLDFTTNALGSFNVLEAAKVLQVPVASCASIHVYGNGINDTLQEQETRYTREPEDIDENHSTLEGILTPLHASKAAAEIYTQVYIDSYHLEAASFRLTGIYGTRQFAGEDHGWVANFAIRGVFDRPITIFGTGKQLRDIIYATDVCEAFDAFYKNRKPGIYNIGGGKLTTISLLECIAQLEDLLGKKLNVQFAPDRHGDLRYFVCNIQKAKQVLQWEPQVMPKLGLKKLINWIQNHQSVFIPE